MRLCVPVLPYTLLAVSALGCQPGAGHRAAPAPSTGPVTLAGQDGPPSTQPTSQPGTSERAGLAALQRWARECYELGLKHNPVFAKGGQLLVRWEADRRGQLLFMDFVVDSFRGWPVDAAGATLADCVVGRAREAPVFWSRTGSAPFRLQPAGP
jgi:hypothetical protein